VCASVQREENRNDKKIEEVAEEEGVVSE